MGSEQERQTVSFEQRWRDRFQGWADKHEDDAGIAGWSPTGLEARLRNFARLWRADAADGVWLDAGCGAGTYTRFLASQQMRVVGMDYCLPAVQKASQRDNGDNAWCVADVRRLPVRQGAFDGALCFGVMQALTESGPALQELSSVVRCGGQVWIDALNGHCLPHLWERLRRRLAGLPPHVRYESPRQLQRLMRRYGLEDVQLYWVPILPGALQRFQGLLETAWVRWLIRHVPLLGALISHAFVLRARRSC
jgi:SAM-dependent methyltransferase